MTRAVGLPEAAGKICPQRTSLVVAHGWLATALVPAIDNKAEPVLQPQPDDGPGNP
jgi:hypothetical protein